MPDFTAKQIENAATPRWWLNGDKNKGEIFRFRIFNMKKKKRTRDCVRHCCSQSLQDSIAWNAWFCSCFSKRSFRVLFNNPKIFFMLLDSGCDFTVKAKKLWKVGNIGYNTKECSECKVLFCLSCLVHVHLTLFLSTVDYRLFFQANPTSENSLARPLSVILLMPCDVEHVFFFMLLKSKWMSNLSKFYWWHTWEELSWLVEVLEQLQRLHNTA